jgi:APA family basic amino acid/polyamine antiporter
VFFVVGAIPILTDMPTEAIAGMGVGMDMLCEFMILVACFNLPRKYPNEFATAQFTFKPKAFYALLVIAGLLMLGTSYVSLQDLTPTNYVVIAVYLVAIFALTQLRFKAMQKKNGPQGVIIHQ